MLLQDSMFNKDHVKEKDMKTPQESFYGSLDVTDHLLDHNFLEDIAKDRKVIPDPIDDRKLNKINL